MTHDFREFATLVDDRSDTTRSVQLAGDIKIFLWAKYDPEDRLIYPIIEYWDDLFNEAITCDSYDSLTKDEVLSMLFGLIHRNRIVEGLWWSMFERGVVQRLLGQLLLLDSDKY